MRSQKVFLHVSGLFCVLALMMTASFFLAVPVWSAGDAGNFVVDVEGVGVIERHNLSRAREKAIEDGLAQALKAAMISVLLSDLPQAKFQEAWRGIAEKRGDYIQKYGITRESSDNTAYRVGVNVTIFVSVLTEKLHSLGYETVRNDHVDKEITLTVSDVRSYEEYAKLHEFLKRGVPCIREVRPDRFSWKEVRFRLTLRGAPGCVTEAKLPFDIQKMTDDEITGEINRQK
jgi:hypothetical protein